MSKNFSAYQSSNTVQTVTIANGATTSSVITCYGTTPLKLFLPSSFTSCNLTYAISFDGINFSNPLKFMDGTVVETVGAVAGDAINIDANTIVGAPYLQIICSSPQTGSQTLTLIGAPVLDPEEID